MIVDLITVTFDFIIKSNLYPNGIQVLVKTEPMEGGDYLISTQKEGEEFKIQGLLHEMVTPLNIYEFLKDIEL